MSAYEFFKDFAGPIATVFAATVAAGVTATFAIRQASIAEHQAETARNKLKADTFKIRFDVYQAAVEAIRIGLYRRPITLDLRKELNSASAKTLEGEFLFNAADFQYLLHVVNLSQRIIDSEQRLALRSGNDLAYDEACKKLEKLRDELNSSFEKLPHRFMGELSLIFLTGITSRRGTQYPSLMLGVIGALLVALLASHEII